MPMDSAAARLSRTIWVSAGAVAALSAAGRRLGLLHHGGRLRRRPSCSSSPSPAVAGWYVGAAWPSAPTGNLQHRRGAAARRRRRRCRTGWWSSTGTTASPSTTAAIRSMMTEALRAGLAHRQALRGLDARGHGARARSTTPRWARTSSSSALAMRQRPRSEHCHAHRRRALGADAREPDARTAAGCC